MQFSILSTCAMGMAAFIAGVQAAPAPAPVARSVFQTFGNFTTSATDSSINDCGDSTFVDGSTGGSPEISDCQQIATNIAGGGSWLLSLDIQRTLATYGTCAFGATGSAVDVGNQDIIDLINTSIDDFSWEGLVGASGSMECDNGPVTWGLYHT